MKPPILLPCVLGFWAVALAMPATAQTADPQQTQSEKCRAGPDAQQNGQAPSSGDQDNSGSQDDSGGQNDNLTGTLDDCNGVLKPPATGDQDMTAPAPDEGSTPVIKPGQVPAQPPAE